VAIVLLELWDTVVPVSKNLGSLISEIVDGLSLPIDASKVTEELLTIMSEGGRRTLMDAVREAIIKASKKSGASISPRTTLMAAKSLLSRIATLKPLETLSEDPGIDLILFTTIDDDVAELIARKSLHHFNGIIGPSRFGLKPNEAYYREALRLRGIVVSSYVVDSINCLRMGVPMIYVDREGGAPREGYVAVVSSISEAIDVVKRLPWP